jgi:hypothetical protein
MTKYVYVNCTAFIVICLMLITTPSGAKENQALTNATTAPTGGQLVSGTIGKAKFKLSEAVFNETLLILHGGDQMLPVGDGKSVPVPLQIKLAFQPARTWASKTFALDTKKGWIKGAPSVSMQCLKNGGVASESITGYQLKLHCFPSSNGRLSGYIELQSTELSGVNVKGYFYANLDKLAI